MEWGLVPFWVKSAEQAGDIANKTLNAKAETIFQLPSFRAAILKRRCIIPVNGFYEWRHFGKKTYPYFIYPKDRSYFCLAGIWEEWTDRETGEIKKTCSIITTAANPLMEQIHNTKMRMSLILNVTDAKRWISPDLKKPDIEILMKPFGQVAWIPIQSAACLPPGLRTQMFLKSFLGKNMRNFLLWYWIIRFQLIFLP